MSDKLRIPASKSAFAELVSLNWSNFIDYVVYEQENDIGEALAKIDEVMFDCQFAGEAREECDASEEWLHCERVWLDGGR